MLEARLPANRASRHIELLNSVAITLFILPALHGLASAQAMLPMTSLAPAKTFFCSAQDLAAAKQLTFEQRACWYGSDLLSPWAAVRAGISSGWGQWTNNPFMRHQDGDQYFRRFAIYYVRRSARETGEMLAGYLNHEDPRPRISGETNFRKRTRSALLSVLITQGDAGNRPTLGPIVGSLGSSFAGAALSHQHDSTAYAFRGAGITYSGYFGRALYQEFRPDLSFLLHRMMHKK